MILLTALIPFLKIVHCYCTLFTCFSALFMFISSVKCTASAGGACYAAHKQKKHAEKVNKRNQV